MIWSLTESKLLVAPGSTFETRASTKPNLPGIGWVTPACGSAKAASATSLSYIEALVVAPMSAITPPELASAATASKLSPASIRARAFAAAASDEKVSWAMVRFSGETKRCDGGLVIDLLRGIVGDLQRFRDIGGRYDENRRFAEFRRAIAVLAHVVIGLHGVVGGRGRLGEIGRRQDEIIGLAALVGEGVDGGEQHAGRFQAAGHGLGDLLAQRRLALFADIGGLGIAVVAQDLVHAGLIERAGGAGEHLLGLDGRRYIRVGQREAQALGVLIERGAGQQLGQHLPVETDLARLVVGDGALGLTLDALQRGLVFAAILRDTDFRVADLRQLVGPEIGEDVANAEEAEADHDQPGEGRENGAAEDVLRHDPKTVEHGAFLSGGRAEGLAGQGRFGRGL